MTFGRDNCQLAGAPLPTRAAPPAPPPPGSCHEGSGLRYYRPLRSCHLALGNVWSGADSANYRLATPAPRSGDGTFFLDTLYMGGVDLVDGAVAAYRPVIRWKKWYGTLVTNAFGLLRVASWRMYRSCNGRSVDQLVFTREVALELLKKKTRQEPCPPNVTGSGPGPSSGRVTVVSRTAQNHFIVPAATQGRCKLCQKIRVQCVASAKYDCITTAARTTTPRLPPRCWHCRCICSMH